VAVAVLAFSNINLKLAREHFVALSLKPSKVALSFELSQGWIYNWRTTTLILSKLNLCICALQWERFPAFTLHARSESADQTFTNLQPPIHPQMQNAVISILSVNHKALTIKRLSSTYWFPVFTVNLLSSGCSPPFSPNGLIRFHWKLHRGNAERTVGCSKQYSNNRLSGLVSAAVAFVCRMYVLWQIPVSQRTVCCLTGAVL
jgi:hypothetical protein